MPKEFFHYACYSFIMSALSSNCAIFEKIYDVQTEEDNISYMRSPNGMRDEGREKIKGRAGGIQGLLQKTGQSWTHTQHCTCCGVSAAAVACA